MINSAKWNSLISRQSVTAAVGIATLIGAAVYIFCTSSSSKSGGQTQYSKKAVIELLYKLDESQANTRARLEEMARRVKEENLTLEQMASDFEANPCDEGVEALGFSAPELDRIIESYRHDPDVSNALNQLLFRSCKSTPNTNITTSVVVQAHDIMVQRLRQFQEEISAYPNIQKNRHTVFLIAQVYIMVAVKEALNVSPTDIELATVSNFEELQKNASFIALNLTLQKLLKALQQ